VKPCVAIEPPPGHVFVESLAKIDPRKVVEVMRLTRHKNNASATHFFVLSPKLIARFRCKRARLSLCRPHPHLPSFIQIDLSFRQLLAKMTFQIVTVIGNADRRSEWIADNNDGSRLNTDRLLILLLSPIVNRCSSIGRKITRTTQLNNSDAELRHRDEV